MGGGIITQGVIGQGYSEGYFKELSVSYLHDRCNGSVSALLIKCYQKRGGSGSQKITREFTE